MEEMAIDEMECADAVLVSAAFLQWETGPAQAHTVAKCF